VNRTVFIQRSRNRLILGPVIEMIMINVVSKYKELSNKFDLFRMKFYTLHRIYKLVTLARKRLDNVFMINGKRSGSRDEFIYRSIIYTLFYSNYVSIILLLKQEKLEIDFDYVDTKLILRAIIERCITQKFILTDPVRLADMFIYWGRIENKRFHISHEKLEQSDPESLALEMDFEGWFNEWNDEKEYEYLEMRSKWESLVQPKQEAIKAKSWSGYSIAEMAKLTGLDDLYKLTYRETSWYSHGLISVSDFFLRPREEGSSYSHTTNNLLKIECYLQTLKLFTLSFLTTDEALGWNSAQEINKAIGDISSYSWVLEFIRLYFFI
jgi:hypothetical protein